MRKKIRKNRIKESAIYEFIVVPGRKSLYYQYRDGKWYVMNENGEDLGVVPMTALPTELQQEIQVNGITPAEPIEEPVEYEDEYEEPMEDVGDEYECDEEVEECEDEDVEELGEFPTTVDADEESPVVESRRKKIRERLKRRLKERLRSKKRVKRESESRRKALLRKKIEEAIRRAKIRRKIRESLRRKRLLRERRRRG